MVTLDEQMALDAKATLNKDEFGSPMTYEGLSVVGSWEPLDQSSGEIEGYVVDQRRYFICFPDQPLPPLPMKEQEVSIDNIDWIVDQADDPGQMFELEVTRNMS